MSHLDRVFKLRANHTTVGTELRAGVVTFLTMSYILFVQPIVLSGTGLGLHTVFVATCISAAIATFLMAFTANYPIALAPAMGHNFLFLEYCRNGTVNWQTALGAVFISGMAFLILSLWGVREKIINAVPSSLKHAIAVGIGLLIAFVGLQWAGLVVDAPGTLVTLGDLHPKPVLLAMGGLLFTGGLIALRLRGAILIGILVTAAAGVPLGITSTESLEKKGVFALPKPDPMRTLAILPVQVPAGANVDPVPPRVALKEALSRHYDAEAVVTADATAKILAEAGVTVDPAAGPRAIAELAAEHLNAELLLVPKIEGAKDGFVLHVVAYDACRDEPWRDYGTVPLGGDPDRLRAYAKDVALGLPGHDGLLRLDVLGALKLGILHVIFIFFFLDLFDTIGTLIGVAQQAGFLRDGKLPRARGALLADACGTVVGAGLGTSTVTSYIESSAGVADGARTGLANIVTALLFVVALFFSPIVEMVGGEYHGLHPAVAPVLIIIGCIMVRNVAHIRWTDATEALPAFLAIMIMPLTFSITEGISFGFITFSFLKLVTGRGREVHWLVYLFSALFVVRYVCLVA